MKTPRMTRTPATVSGRIAKATRNGMFVLPLTSTIATADVLASGSRPVIPYASDVARGGEDALVYRDTGGRRTSKEAAVRSC